MRNILTVETEAKSKDLTTLARVKLELKITDGKSDDLLKVKISEASNDIILALGYEPIGETVMETFWHEGPFDTPDYLVMQRKPITAVNSITVDEVVIDAACYRVDEKLGLIYRLVNGYPTVWYFNQSVVINYAGGYIAISDPTTNVPPGLQGAAVELLVDFWKATGRDPSVKSVNVTGILETEYWVGAVGEEGELPPRVVMKLAPFRRAKIA